MFGKKKEEPKEKEKKEISPDDYPDQGEYLKAKEQNES